MAVGVFSKDGDYDSLFLSNYLDVYIKDAVKRVPGVGDVVIFGERKYSMRLWLDPDRLAARGLTAGDVVQALREQNVQVAAGSLGQAPAPSGQMYQLSVRARRPAHARRPSSTTSSSRAARTGRSSASRTSAAPSSARRPTPPTCASRASRRSASASPSCRTRTRSTSNAP